MESTDENIESLSKYDTVNPWTDIWLQPRTTIKWITTYRSGLSVPMLLIYFGSVYWGLHKAHIDGSADTKVITSILLIALFFSGIGGLIVYNIIIVLIDLAATWLGGRGNIKTTQLAFAWSTVPSMAGLLITIIAIALFEDEFFTSQMVRIDQSRFLSIAFWIYTLSTLVFGVWHVCLLLLTISEVQKITKTKAALSILIAGLLFISPVVIITILYLSV